MNELEREPSPEQLERDRLVRIIREYLPEDEAYLLETYPDPDDVEDLRMAIDGMFLAEGLDPDQILMEAGEYVDVRYKPDNITVEADTESVERHE